MTKFTHWTEEEEEFVKDNYGKRKTAEIAEFLSRTPHAVRRKANDLGCYLKIERLKDGLHYCNSCREYKEFDQFYKNTKSATGLYHSCKPCSSIKAKYDYHSKKFEQEEKRKKEFIESKKGQKFYCSRCNELKTIDYYHIYYRSKGDRYERRTTCVPCASIKHKEFKLEKERQNAYVNFTLKP